MFGKPIDKLGFFIALLIAVIALLIVIFMMNIIERTDQRLQTIRTTKVTGPEPSFSSAITSKSELGSIKLGEDEGHPAYYLTDQNLTAETFAKMAQTPNLQAVVIKRCDYKGALLADLSKLPIESVRILETDVDEDTLEQLSKMKKLRAAQLIRCTIKHAGFPYLKHSQIVWLEMRDCRSDRTNGEITVDDFKSIDAMPLLGNLELEKSQLQKGALNGLSKSKLRMINCAFCEIENADVQHLAKLQELQCINLKRDPNVTCAGLTSLLKSPRIMQIRFDRDRLDCRLSASDERKINRVDFSMPLDLRQRFAKY